jgi:osmotically inducible protein OsmC
MAAIKRSAEVVWEGTITTSELEVVGRVAGIDEAAFERAAHVAEESCPVSRALPGNVEIRSHTRLKGH